MTISDDIVSAQHTVRRTGSAATARASPDCFLLFCCGLPENVEQLRSQIERLSHYMSTTQSMSDSEEDPHLKFWRALHGVLKGARDTLPYAAEPEHIHWDHPDDDWKNNSEVQAIEDNFSVETDSLIRHYCLKRSWPKRSKNNARHFAKERIRWALAFVRIFTIPLPETGVAALPRPPQSGWKFLEWLLIDAYHQRFSPPQKTPFYVSGPDGKVTEIWS